MEEMAKNLIHYCVYWLIAAFVYADVYQRLDPIKSDFAKERPEMAG